MYQKQTFYGTLFKALGFHSLPASHNQPGGLLAKFPGIKHGSYFNSIPSFTTHGRKKKIKKKEKRNLGTRRQFEVSRLTSELILKAEFFYSWLFKQNKWPGRLDKGRGTHTIQYGEAQRPTVAEAERWADWIHELIIITSLQHSDSNQGPGLATDAELMQLLQSSYLYVQKI